MRTPHDRAITIRQAIEKFLKQALDGPQLSKEEILERTQKQIAGVYPDLFPGWRIEVEHGSRPGEVFVFLKPKHEVVELTIEFSGVCTCDSLALAQSGCKCRAAKRDTNGSSA